MTLGAMPGSPSKVKMVHEHNIQYIKLEDEIDIDSGDSFYKDAEQVATLHNNNFGARHFKNRQPYKTKMIKYDELQHLKQHQHILTLQHHPSTENLNLKVLKKDMSPRAVLRKNPSRYPIKKTDEPKPNG